MILAGNLNLCFEMPNGSCWQSKYYEHIVLLNGINLQILLVCHPVAIFGLEAFFNTGTPSQKFETHINTEKVKCPDLCSRTLRNISNEDFFKKFNKP